MATSQSVFGNDTSNHGDRTIRTGTEAIVEVEATQDSSEIKLDPSSIKVQPVEIEQPGPTGTGKAHRYEKHASNYVRPSVLKKHFSEPVFREISEEKYPNETRIQFDNPAFDPDEALGSNMTFADVVKQVIQQPIEEDMHPFGRGNIYAAVFSGKRRVSPDDNGTMVVWVLVALVILGMAFGVIFMSATYHDDVSKGKPEVTTINLLHNVTVAR